MFLPTDGGWEEHLDSSLHWKLSLGHRSDLAGSTVFFQQLHGLLLVQQTMLVGTWGMDLEAPSFRRALSDNISLISSGQSLSHSLQRLAERLWV